MTQTTLNDQFVFPIIFLSDIKEPLKATWRQLGLTDKNLKNAQDYLAFDRR